VLVNFGQKNLSQFVDAFKEFFMIQFLKLNSTAYRLIRGTRSLILKKPNTAKTAGRISTKEATPA